MTINITASPGVIVLSSYAVRTQWPAIPKDFMLDSGFDCDYEEAIPVVTFSAHGSWLNVDIDADPGVITLVPLGNFPSGFTITAEAGIITLRPTGSIVVESIRQNWVKWSGIGNLDFTIGRDNVAGERPLDWSGWIYAIKKLGNKVIAYGKNGVSILNPSDKFYGLDTIHHLGLYSQGTVAGSDNVHFFIDKKAQLWALGEKLEFFGYIEYLSNMISPVMSYDIENELIYICDGVYGFVYSLRDRSFGTCSPNITGAGLKDGTLYITSSADIATPTFELCTDIYDMGTRKFKTIRSVEIGTNLAETMEASVEYRVSKAGNFSNNGWHLVNPNGETFLPCYGLEFRFKLRVQTYEYFEIDYIKLNGLIHHYSYTEHMLRSVNGQRNYSYGS